MGAGVVALVTVGCGGSKKESTPAVNEAVNQAPEAVDQQARDDIKKINDYLGTTGQFGAGKDLVEDPEQEQQGPA
jgi:hypothetical protein